MIGGVTMVVSKGLRSRCLVPVCFVLVMPFFALGLGPLARAEKLPSFSAIHEGRHEPSGRRVTYAAIELSSYGFRARDLLEDGSVEIVQSFSDEKAWFVDHVRRVAHPLQLIEEPEHRLLSPSATSSFLSAEPCGLLFAEQTGRGTWRGRDVSVFVCKTESGDEASVEFIDEILGIVVYQRDQAGFVNELQRLLDRSFDKEHFRPPSNYRTVGREEFFVGRPALKQYKEKPTRK